MNGQAPNCSATGSHVLVVRNARPNLWSVGQECTPVLKNASSTTASTASAKAWVIRMKSVSPRLLRPEGRTGIDCPAGVVVKAIREPGCSGRRLAPAAAVRDAYFVTRRWPLAGNDFSAAALS